MRVQKLTAAAAAAFALLATTPAHATGMIAGATFPEQIVQELTLVEQYATQAQQLQAQFQMVYNQAVNMQTIPSQLWPNISGQLQNLINLVGVDDQWRNPSANPTPQTNVALKIRTDRKIRRAFLATPDDGLGRPRALPIKQDETGITLLVVPRLAFWDLVVLAP